MKVETGQDAGLGNMLPSVASGGIDARANPADFGATNAQYVAGIGQGLDQAASTLDKFARQDALINAQSKAFADQVQWHQKLRQMQQEAPPGAPGFTQSFSQQFDDWRKQQLDAAPNAIERAALAERYNELGAVLGDKASAFEQDALTTHRETQLKGMLDNASALLFTDPSQIGVVQKHMVELIGNSDLPPAAKEKLQLNVTHATSAAAWRGMMENDPKGTMQALLTGNAPGLDFQDRFAILGESRALLREEHAQQMQEMHLRLAMQDRAEREQDKALKRQQDATERQGYQLANGGQLTPDWLKANAAHLTPSSLNYLGQVLQGAHTVTNPDLYTDLHETIRGAGSQAERDQATEAANEAVRQQLLKPEDRDKLEALAQHVAKTGDQLPAWAKEGDKSINLMAGINDLNPAAGAKERLANGLDAWHEWIRANPQADREQARKEWLNIGKSVQLIDPDQMTITMPRPTYLVQTPPAKAGEQGGYDWDATADAIVAAKDSGEIDDFEMRRQLALTNQWRKATQQQAAATAAAAGK